MSGLKVPDAPTLIRSPKVEADSPAPTNTTTADGRDFVPRTVKTFAVVVAAGVFVLASIGRFGWIAPFIGGAVLGTALLVAWEYVIRRVITAEQVLLARGVISPENGDGTAPKKKFGGKRALLAFALIKYPAVGLLLWWVARHMTQQEIAAFISGFVLLQIVIGLRGLGAYLFPTKSGK